jgi:hypothetical protein
MEFGDARTALDLGVGLDTPVLPVERGVRHSLEACRLLVVDWAPSATEGDKVLFVFDGGLLEPGQLGRIRLVEDEIASFEFVDPPCAQGRTVESTIWNMAPNSIKCVATPPGPRIA